MTTQQEFLRKAALELGLSQKDLEIRMAAPWETFRKWLMPVTADRKLSHL